MIEIIGYFMSAWALGWCTGFSFLAWKRFTEVSTSS